jgi:acetyl esterase/lipase
MEKKRPCVLICPGGAYSYHCEREAEPVALRLIGAGINAAVCRYGTASDGAEWPDQLAEVSAALTFLRRHAEEWGCDPQKIVVMGFSAGGHLTLMTATSSRSHAYLPKDDIDKFSCHVNWACPIYPAYALTDGLNQVNAQGGNEDSAVLAPEFAFDPSTPPMCFIHGDADKWAAMNSVKAWEQLRRMGIQSDLHTLAKRGHCFHFAASPGTGSYTCFDRIREFLNHKGYFKP